MKRKAPKFLPDAEVLLAEMSYELILAVDHAEKLIRDAKDQPILNVAIVSDVDIILTGDKVINPRMGQIRRVLTFLPASNSL